MLNDPLVLEFENGSLKLNEFNHRKHVYIAWCYLKCLPFDDAVKQYCKCLWHLLDAAGQSHRFNLAMTESYFSIIDNAIDLYQTNNFDEFIVQSSLLLKVK